MSASVDVNVSNLCVQKLLNSTNFIAFQGPGSNIKVMMDMLKEKLLLRDALICGAFGFL